MKEILEYPGDTRTINEECQYNNESKSFSNLNGMFDVNQDHNQRQLVLCLEDKIEDCIQLKRSNYDRIFDWKLKNTKLIKLSETKMWLKRSESDLDYDMRVSLIQDPPFANAGKHCYWKCGGKQGPCWWCGKEGMCCSQSSKTEFGWRYYEVGFENGCDGTFGGKTKHECVLKKFN